MYYGIAWAWHGDWLSYEQHGVWVFTGAHRTIQDWKSKGTAKARHQPWSDQESGNHWHLWSTPQTNNLLLHSVADLRFDIAASVLIPLSSSFHLGHGVKIEYFISTDDEVAATAIHPIRSNPSHTICSCHPQSRLTIPPTVAT